MHGNAWIPEPEELRDTADCRQVYAGGFMATETRHKCLEMPGFRISLFGVLRWSHRLKHGVLSHDSYPFSGPDFLDRDATRELLCPIS